MIFTILLAVWLKIKLKSKYCSGGCDKKHFNKELVMAENVNDVFENSMLDLWEWLYWS